MARSLEGESSLYVHVRHAADILLIRILGTIRRWCIFSTLPVCYSSRVCVCVCVCVCVYVCVEHKAACHHLLCPSVVSLKMFIVHPRLSSG